MKIFQPFYTFEHLSYKKDFLIKFRYLLSLRYHKINKISKRKKKLYIKAPSGKSTTQE